MRQDKGRVNVGGVGVEVDQGNTREVDVGGVGVKADEGKTKGEPTKLS